MLLLMVHQVLTTPQAMLFFAMGKFRFNDCCLHGTGCQCHDVRIGMVHPDAQIFCCCHNSVVVICRSIYRRLRTKMIICSPCALHKFQKDLHDSHFQFPHDRLTPALRFRSGFVFSGKTIFWPVRLKEYKRPRSAASIRKRKGAGAQIQINRQRGGMAIPAQKSGSGW